MTGRDAETGVAPGTITDTPLHSTQSLPWGLPLTFGEVSQDVLCP